MIRKSQDMPLFENDKMSFAREASPATKPKKQRNVNKTNLIEAEPTTKWFFSRLLQGLQNGSIRAQSVRPGKSVILKADFRAAIGGTQANKSRSAPDVVIMDGDNQLVYLPVKPVMEYLEIMAMAEGLKKYTNKILTPITLGRRLVITETFHTSTKVDPRTGNPCQYIMKRSRILAKKQAIKYWQMSLEVFMNKMGVKSPSQAISLKLPDSGKSSASETPEETMLREPNDESRSLVESGSSAWDLAMESAQKTVEMVAQAKVKAELSGSVSIRDAVRAAWDRGEMPSKLTEELLDLVQEVRSGKWLGENSSDD